MTDPVMLLSQLHGEGRVTFRALRAAGFFTLAAVSEATVQVLADRAHLSQRSARRLKTGAEELIGAGVGSDLAEGEPSAAPRRSRRNGSRTSFSEGVTHDEAILLGQGAVGLAVEETASASPDSPEPFRVTGADPADGGSAEADPPLLSPGPPPELIKAMAAAAEAAASLIRQPSRKESAPRPTFWAFG